MLGIVTVIIIISADAAFWRAWRVCMLPCTLAFGRRRGAGARPSGAGHRLERAAKLSAAVSLRETQGPGGRHFFACA